MKQQFMNKIQRQKYNDNVKPQLSVNDSSAGF